MTDPVDPRALRARAECVSATTDGGCLLTELSDGGRYFTNQPTRMLICQLLAQIASLEEERDSLRAKLAAL